MMRRDLNTHDLADAGRAAGVEDLTDDGLSRGCRGGG
jgi:hypothetical protein